MSQRRMFSPQIVSSDAFLDMPTSSRELYFQLGMFADDDGFINPKRIIRMVGASEDDLKILISKRFVLTFENGVIVIKHWRMNNLVRKDWYRPTQYIDEKKTLFLKENGSYTQDFTQGKPVVNEMLTSSVQFRSRRLGKDRLGKDSIEDDNVPIKSVSTDLFESFWSSYPKKEQKRKAQEIWKRKKLDEHLPTILKFVKQAIVTDRWKKGFIKQPTAFLNGECWNDDLSGYMDAQSNKSNSIIIR